MLGCYTDANTFFLLRSRRKRNECERMERAQPPRAFQGSPRKVELRRKDVALGPFTIDEPDTLVLVMEDIEFNFGFPDPAESPFHLGFFAGIMIGAPRVTIDLRGHTLSQSPQMRERQRFFALIELDVTPFPLKPGIGFTTPPRSPSDITIRNGTLGESSHFAVHGATAGDRILLSGLRMEAFEVGAVSISGAADVMIHRCKIGRPAKPKTSSEVAMLRDLARECRGIKMDRMASQLDLMCVHPDVRAPDHSDAIVRCIVISPVMNVGLPKLDGNVRTKRISIVDVEFDDVHAEPKGVVGCSLVDGGDPIKDRLGNLVRWEDAASGAPVSRAQASISPDMDATTRRRLMHGPHQFHKVFGLDLRAHELRQKSSALVRIDGADGVTLHDLRGGIVKSVGDHSAAVGFMLNACRKVSMRNVRMRGVQVTDACVSTLSDERPQSGVYLRHCEHVDLENVRYSDETACACVLRDARNANLVACQFAAPFTALRSDPLRYSS